MRNRQKMIIEIVHDETYQSVFHLQFLPSPFIYKGGQKLARGGTGPFDTEGLLSAIKGYQDFRDINLITNISEPNLSMMIKGFTKDCSDATYNVVRID